MNDATAKCFQHYVFFLCSFHYITFFVHSQKNKGFGWTIKSLEFGLSIGSVIKLIELI